MNNGGRRFPHDEMIDSCKPLHQHATVQRRIYKPGSTASSSVSYSTFCPLGEASCRRMGAVVMIFEVSICWCSTAVTAVGCSDALEPGGSRGVMFLPLWAILVGYHSLSAEGVSVRWGSLKGC